MTLSLLLGLSFSALLAEELLMTPLLGRKGMRNAFWMGVWMLLTMELSSLGLFVLRARTVNSVWLSVGASLLVLLVSFLLRLLLRLFRPERLEFLRPVFAPAECNCAMLCCLVIRGGGEQAFLPFVAMGILLTLLFLALLALLSAALERVWMLEATAGKRIPQCFRGMPLTLLTAAVLCLALGAWNLTLW